MEDKKIVTVELTQITYEIALAMAKSNQISVEECLAKLVELAIRPLDR